MVVTRTDIASFRGKMTGQKTISKKKLPWMTSKTYFLLIFFNANVFLRKTADENKSPGKKIQRLPSKTYFLLNFLKPVVLPRKHPRKNNSTKNKFSSDLENLFFVEFFLVWSPTEKITNKIKINKK